MNIKNDDKIYIPVAFTHVIDNIQGQQHIQSNSKFVFSFLLDNSSVSLISQGSTEV